MTDYRFQPGRKHPTQVAAQNTHSNDFKQLPTDEKLASLLQ
ncbi:hypothetical protein LC55x_2612 [Lysobacter capsici]|nr:hypothetical protein LC55x_2612 [Lysobacter capsici]